MSRHVNIPIFIPHLGCPNQCVFCNQKTISGITEFERKDVIHIIEKSLETIEDDAEIEIAFFGGSFTGINRELMIDLLSIAHSYIISGRVKSIRCSTRPDYINDEILKILKIYGVSVIELGLQSTSNSVLTLTKRGHDKECELIACKKIKKAGFKLVGQMMIGLPGSSIHDEIETAQFIAEIGADEARIYPTIVFRDTELYEMAISGKYEPLSEHDAVIRSTAAFTVLIKHNVKVIRIGLCASENLQSDVTYYAGPNHPSIGELVAGEFYYSEISKKLSGLSLNDITNLTIYVGRGEISKAIGHNKKNRTKLLQEYGLIKVLFAEKSDLRKYEVNIAIERK